MAAAFLRRTRGPGARARGARQRADTGARAPRVPVHRHARRGQDDHRAHPRQVPQLRDRRHRDALRQVRHLHARSTRAASSICIEVDAASRTKVDDTRELLENVQYAPTRGRYKVYLVDEVHMLSTHSFNALLKTLEEPPPHVKFLLATTDPQKLPVTVLSRCLQFNLKRLPVALISEHLGKVLAAEKIPADAGRPAPGGAGRRRQHARRAVAARSAHRLRRRQGRRSRAPAACSAPSIAHHVVHLARALAAGDAAAAARDARVRSRSFRPTTARCSMISRRC